MSRRPLDYRRRAWDAAALADLVRRWEAGDPCEEIAADTHRSPDAIKLRAWKLGLRGRRECRGWTTGEVRRLRELWEAGEKAGAIARSIGRTEGAVIKMAGRLGHQRRRNCRYPLEVKEKALAMLRAGRTVGEVHRRLGVSLTQASRWRRDAGIPRSTRDEHRRMTLRGIRRAPLCGGKAASISIQEKVAAEGWPFGARKADARVLAALEAAARPLRIVQIAAAVGLKLAPAGRYENPALNSRLCRMREAGWVVRVAKCPVSYGLAEWVRDQRTAARSGKKEGVPA